MATLTKNTKTPANPYQVWEPGDISLNDILDIEASLGGRAAKSITIESPDGESKVQFNVVKRIFKNHHERGNSGVIPYAAFYRSPLLVGEVEESTPTITIPQGNVQQWTSTSVLSIKITQKAPGLRIIAE